MFLLQSHCLHLAKTASHDFFQCPSLVHTWVISSCSDQTFISSTLPYLLVPAPKPPMADCIPLIPYLLAHFIQSCLPFRAQPRSHLLCGLFDALQFFDMICMLPSLALGYTGNAPRGASLPSVGEVMVHDSG